MKVIYPDSYPSRDLHQFMLGSVIPRPIALVSTISNKGIKNLAPFSYFNAISSDPPILGFSVSDRKDGSLKDTLANIEENGECVINLVNYDISHQMTLAGVDFPPDTDEFLKCGFTPVPSSTVAPYGIENAPVRFECIKDRIIYFGERGNKTALIVCNVICIHYDEVIMNDQNRIDPVALDLIGRLGRTNYLKLTKDNIFSIAQSRSMIPIGYDNLPESIVKSSILTGNEIAIIAGIEKNPDPEFIKTTKEKYKLIATDINSAHKLASQMIKSGNIEEAAALLFFSF
jgi:flavin reductase (DIM6/NTAB) family NADH-FMN oxidoreductase RutF